MKVQQERLQADINRFASFGALPGGGGTRLAFSEEDIAARDYLADQMRAAGLEISVDAFGNVRGRRPGRKTLAPVVIGSHLDTVPEGGSYDGVVGVVAALEVIRVLNESQLSTLRPVEVICFSAEESARFGVGTMGSKVMAGKVAPDDLQRYRDKSGIPLWDALLQAGFQPEALMTAQVTAGEIYAFLELHIEQGPVLEMEGKQIGVVTAIAAPTRFRVSIHGRADHSGNTPMTMRQDALAGAAELVLGVERIAGRQAGEATVGTVGYLTVKPGAMNVIPGEVELGIDIRDINCEDKKQAVTAVQELMTRIAAKRNLTIQSELLADEQPVLLSEKLIKLLEDKAISSGFSYKTMPSGAGHDAMHMASITAAGMIFIPSIDGISHNVKEYSRIEDIVTGADLLLSATIALAGRVNGNG